MHTVADYLFIASLLTLIVNFVFVGGGGRGFTYNGGSAEAHYATDLQMQQDPGKVFKRQDSVVKRYFKSKLFWIAAAGIVISVIMSEMG
ncbi:hypothetical protein NLX71_21870 [Paenibacillus sp. MZ04-78.2]|uniref:hypothetical protein n=1 Tax=Paenibacillus sp. MZ04-78.2 TaxID=2962034 RepID=UPI0020B6C7C7|nr:hypothetical protein [Paenibacillus sp. MZ04-78.2]MCP3775922.1 hypothetical protein [Paenibacillus sp. MZ04-78.2]